MKLEEERIAVTPGWRDLPVADWRSPIVIVGASDSGKTTFARYLYRRLLEGGEPIALIDMDPGQNVFGLPTTAAIGLGTGTADGFPPEGHRRHLFTCSNSPVGHEARVLQVLARLKQQADAEAARRVIVDTSGFVDVAHGAADLKWAKVDLLRPCTVVAFQREQELVPIIEPWRHCHGVDLVVLPISDHVRTRSREARRAYRTSCYRKYFANARRIPLHFADVALYASGPWSRHQLIALEDAEGYVLALALIEEISEAVVWLTTPLKGSDGVAAIRMGDIGLHPFTFEDTHV
jgi:polynucleotide 5'-hydroxyl-kinase GRC3/NOL9